MENAIIIIKKKKIRTLKTSKTFHVSQSMLQEVTKLMHLTSFQASHPKLGRKPGLPHEQEKELVSYHVQNIVLLV